MLFIVNCLKRFTPYIKSKNITLVYINYLILIILKNIKIKASDKVQLYYLNQKIWFLVINPVNKLSIKNLSIKKFNIFYVNIYFKLQKLNFFFIDSVQKFFSKKQKFRVVYLTDRKRYIFIKHNIIKEQLDLQKKKVYVNVTFAKKNTFFNVSSPKGETVYATTMLREGYLGKKRKAYISMFSIASVIHKLISNFYINEYCNIYIIYKGWNRFRSAIKAAFNKKKFYNLRIKYIKYIVKIPHNGCRAPKQRNRLRMQKYFVKKKY